MENEYAKTKLNLEKKKSKIFGLHDPLRWEVPGRDLKGLPK
jgi:hypothetical protein